jgi:hypothetical protein
MVRFMGYLLVEYRCILYRMWIFFKKFIPNNSHHFIRILRPNILRIETDRKINLLHRLPHVINPTFSSAKLKLMSPFVNECIQAMLDKVSQMIASEINIY